MGKNKKCPAGGRGYRRGSSTRPLGFLLQKSACARGGDALLLALASGWFAAQGERGGSARDVSLPLTSHCT